MTRKAAARLAFPQAGAGGVMGQARGFLWSGRFRFSLQGSRGSRRFTYSGCRGGPRSGKEGRPHGTRPPELCLRPEVREP